MIFNEQQFDVMPMWLHNMDEAFEEASKLQGMKPPKKKGSHGGTGGLMTPTSRNNLHANIHNNLCINVCLYVGIW